MHIPMDDETLSDRRCRIPKRGVKADSEVQFALDGRIVKESE